MLYPVQIRCWMQNWLHERTWMWKCTQSCRCQRFSKHSSPCPVFVELENHHFYFCFCFVQLSVLLNFSLFVNNLENSSLCELSTQTGVCFVGLGNDHFRHLSVHDQEECYKLEEYLLMSNTVYCETLEEYLSSLLKSCASCKIIVEYLST